MMSIQAASYNVRPDTGLDQCEKINKMLRALRDLKGPCTVSFQPGVYHLEPAKAPKLKAYISNTASEKENPDVTKSVGMLIKGHKNIRLEGNGAKFICRGKMTELMVIDSDQVSIKGISFDYERPTVSEFRVVDTGMFHIDIAIHERDSYRLTGKRIQWIGENWMSHGSLCVRLSESDSKCRRVQGPLKSVRKITELKKNLLRLHYWLPVIPYTIKVNDIYQVRDGIRDQVGVWFNRSSNVTLDDVQFNFMHGLGVVGQQSSNLTFMGVRFAPEEGSGRTCSAFADFLHLSGCSGDIKVQNCHFEGAHDDCINVHGTHLKVIRQPAPNLLSVRYMHPQTYGFMPYKQGDKIALISSDTLLSYEIGEVQSCIRKDDRNYVIRLKSAIDKLKPNTVVENMSERSDVLIENNTFTRVPTRGVLLSNGGKAVVKNNRFIGTVMSGILIADDASSWYESGPVEDVTIEGNRFVECGGPVIAIKPENSRHAGGVHKNIRIIHNVFEGGGSVQEVAARSVSGLEVKGNLKIGSAVEVKTKYCVDAKIEV